MYLYIYMIPIKTDESIVQIHLIHWDHISI